MVWTFFLRRVSNSPERRVDNVFRQVFILSFSVLNQFSSRWREAEHLHCSRRAASHVVFPSAIYSPVQVTFCSVHEAPLGFPQAQTCKLKERGMLKRFGLINELRKMGAAFPLRGVLPQSRRK